MVRYDDLTLEKVIFEARFRDRFLYWDNCGKVCLKISNKWPSLVTRAVSTDIAQFQLVEPEIHFAFGVNRISCHEDYPGKLDTFKIFLNDSLQTVVEYLQIDTYTRIGNRYQYVMRVDDADKVTDVIAKIGLINVPTKLNIFGKKIVEPDVRIVFERDDISTKIRVSFFKRKVEINKPKPMLIDTSNIINQGILIDLDFFSTKTVERGILDVEEFVTVHQRSARKVIETLFS